MKVNDENTRIRIQDPDPNPDPLVRGMDPRIRIRIHPKMSWILLLKCFGYLGVGPGPRGRGDSARGDPLHGEPAQGPPAARLCGGNLMSCLPHPANPDLNLPNQNRSQSA